MRVAMVSEHASPLAVLGGVDAGGQNVHVAALSAALGRRGVDVVVHTRRDDPKLPGRAHALGFVVDHVDAGPPRAVPKDELLPHMDEFAKRLYRAWSRERPDVVHAHFWMSGKAALEAARPLGIPVVLTFHALGVVKRRHQGSKDTSPEGRIEIEQAIARGVDWIVATCTDEVSELEALGADLGRVSVVPCGVDLQLFADDGPAERRNGLRRLVTVGRLVERKGIGDAIEALAGLADTELVVAGGPPAAELEQDAEARRLLTIAKRAGVAGRVRLRGRIERGEVPPLLRSADAVLCVPWYEPFGIVPLEAMACGVPVIATAVGGMLDTVVDGVTGIHVPTRRPDRIAAAARRLSDAPAEAAALGAAGVARARALYSWERIASETLDVYGALAGAAERARVALA
jgi:D-inositol-3-phosphate glycosyltransferase